MSEKKCGHTVNCGCEDAPLTTGYPCEGINCTEEDPCPETFCEGCVVNCNDTIVDIGMEKGERLDVTLQRLTLLALNPDCVLPGNPCQSALGLKSKTILPSTITVQWNSVATATSYTVEYKQAAAVSWTLNPLKTPGVLSTETDTVSGLLPDTEYHIRVNTTCATGACYSVTILVKTKQSS